MQSEDDKQVFLYNLREITGINDQDKLITLYYQFNGDITQASNYCLDQQFAGDLQLCQPMQPDFNIPSYSTFLPVRSPFFAPVVQPTSAIQPVPMFDVPQQDGVVIKKESPKKEEKPNNKPSIFGNIEDLFKVINTPKPKKAKLVETPIKVANEKDIIIELAKLTKWKEITYNGIYNHIQQQLDNKISKQTEENCSICICELYDGVYKLPAEKRNDLTKLQELGKEEIPVIQLSKCVSHFFHKQCLAQGIMAEKQKITELFHKCCVCGAIYGVVIGTQPANGRMTIQIVKNRELSLKGFEKCNTIEIIYSFPNGTMNGHKYDGTERVAFLPDNKEGREVLELLKICFERRLTFKVGTSVTTGMSNQVVWNGVHHKTHPNGGATNFGYPDPTYFNRVKEELAAKGITVADIKSV
jgi:hypothetical protein